MEISNQKIETKTTEENQVFTDEVEIYNPLEAELEHLRGELEAAREARLRLAAEFDNYRRRVRREQSEAGAKGRRELLKRLISLADDLDLAIANVEESPDAVKDALDLLHSRFHGVLEADGVVGFESKGEKFDPERHDAFDVVGAVGETEPGTVATEIRRGYFLNGKLLRPALVVVAQ